MESVNQLVVAAPEASHHREADHEGQQLIRARSNSDVPRS
jgi:hypothetical protein